MNSFNSGIYIISLISNSGVYCKKVIIEKWNANKQFNIYIHKDMLPRPSGSALYKNRIARWFDVNQRSWPKGIIAITSEWSIRIFSPPISEWVNKKHEYTTSNTRGTIFCNRYSGRLGGYFHPPQVQTYYYQFTWILSATQRFDNICLGVDDKSYACHCRKQ